MLLDELRSIDVQERVNAMQQLPRIGTLSRITPVDILFSITTFYSKSLGS